MKWCTRQCRKISCMSYDYAGAPNEVISQQPNTRAIPWATSNCTSAKPTGISHMHGMPCMGYSYFSYARRLLCSCCNQLHPYSNLVPIIHNSFKPRWLESLEMLSSNYHDFLIRIHFVWNCMETPWYSQVVVPSCILVQSLCMCQL